jgi:hypothetical protein
VGSVGRRDLAEDISVRYQAWKASGKWVPSSPKGNNPKPGRYLELVGQTPLAGWAGRSQTQTLGMGTLGGEQGFWELGMGGFGVEVIIVHRLNVPGAQKEPDPEIRRVSGFHSL